MTVIGGGTGTAMTALRAGSETGLRSPGARGTWTR